MHNSQTGNQSNASISLSIQLLTPKFARNLNGPLTRPPTACPNLVQFSSNTFTRSLNQNPTVQYNLLSLTSNAIVVPSSLYCCLYHKQTVYWAAGHNFFISVRALSFKSCIRDGENHSRIVWRLLFLKPNLNLISWCKGTRTPFISNLGTEEMPGSPQV